MPLPSLHTLHMRHYGISAAICAALAEAAEVCLARHHAPPSVIRMEISGNTSTEQLTWNLPSPRSIAAHLNEIDATELGACAISIAALEQQLGLFVISRTKTRSGADYWVHTDPTRRTLEGAIRLEISGMDQATSSELSARLKRKLAQTQSASKLPAWASVVAFRQLRLTAQAT